MVTGKKKDMFGLLVSDFIETKKPWMEKLNFKMLKNVFLSLEVDLYKTDAILGQNRQGTSVHVSPV